jgi:hypothetical protein
MALSVEACFDRDFGLGLTAATGDYEQGEELAQPELGMNSQQGTRAAGEAGGVAHER